MARMPFAQSSQDNETYLDDTRNKSHNVGELLHVDVEVLQIIAKRLVSDDLAPLPHSAETSQVAGRVQLRVRRAWEVDLGELDRRHGRQWSSR